MIKSKKFDDLYNLGKPKYITMLEMLIYTFAAKKSENEYSSGMWKSVFVENEDNSFWYFKLDEEKEFSFENENRQKMEKVSSKCFSLLSFTFALNYVINAVYEKESSEELFVELLTLYHLIIENAGLVLDKNELKIFISIID